MELSRKRRQWNVRRTVAVSGAALFLSAGCDELAVQDCSGNARCYLEVETSLAEIEVGQDVEFDIVIWTSADTNVWLFDDPLCSLMFFEVIDRFVDKSTRHCSERWKTNDDVAEVKAHVNGQSFVSYRRASGNRVAIGPDNRQRYRMIAHTAALDNSEVAISFADDVYFTFIDFARVRFSVRPGGGVMSSEPGAFSSSYAFDFSVSGDTDNRKLSVTRFALPTSSRSQ